MRGAPMEGDGTRHVRFNHGKPRGSNAKRVQAIVRNMTPINTHIIAEEGDVTKINSSGYAAYKCIAVGDPYDITSIRSSANTVAQTWAGSGGMQDGVTGFVYPGRDGRFYVHSYQTDIEMKNQAYTMCKVTLYECLARDNVPVTSTFADVNAILQNGWTAKSIASGGRMTADDQDSTLFMNPQFCHYFKILHQRQISLDPGQEIMVSLTHGHPKCINSLLLGTSPEYMAIRGYTRVIVIRVEGSLTDSGNSTSADTSDFRVIYQATTKYRWNQVYFASEMITQAGTGPDGYVSTAQQSIAPSGNPAQVQGGAL